MTFKSDRYFGLFAKPDEHMSCAPGIEAIHKYFQCYDIANIHDHEILFATYNEGRYHSGHAVVVFERDNILYLVDAKHCSCYGLEGLWKPDEIDWSMLITLNSLSTCWEFDSDADEALYKLISQHVN